ncbi:MAG TPA: metalloregulator ArsR/SmtB family transcription factor [Deltaproteobacteria bacterium]|mgnify:CR=1 FL=1|jgi:ArsR family transcriptional regulator|nr:metalloregulator ArsR/SmtB family transcription factor [Deltaproteobacteria bacterium]HOI06025.1 metalloregulator ArsR/SmtB family transcription factor [Deltaproteobacteria bacterium]
MTKALNTDMDAAVHKAAILKALAHPVRIRIFEALSDGEKTVGDLVQLTGEKDANTSRHLAVLRTAGLVATRKDGLNVYYSNRMPCLVPMLACVNQALRSIADEHLKVVECIRL